MDREIMRAPLPDQWKAADGMFTVRSLWMIIGISVILYFGRTIFIPLAFASLISFVLYPACSWMERRGLSRGVSIAICVLIVTILMAVLAFLLAAQFVKFLDEWPTLRSKIAGSLTALSQWMADVYGFSQQSQQSWLSSLSDRAITGVITLLQGALTASAVSIVMAILIPVYTVLILYYRTTWIEVICSLFPDTGREVIYENLLLTIQTYYNFIKGMGIVYLAVGILNSAGLLIIGVPHAILFGFIASILTFIPYIGIMVGSLLPIAMSWIAYDSVWYPLGVVVVFTIVQYLEANVIFPFAVSSRLNVNTLVMLVTIFLGGVLWGVSGMILFVPFVGITKLLADRTGMHALSMLLGTKK
jgi:predicted PurR-regulated permease PerM